MKYSIAPTLLLLIFNSCVNLKNKEDSLKKGLYPVDVKIEAAIIMDILSIEKRKGKQYDGNLLYIVNPKLTGFYAVWSSGITHVKDGDITDRFYESPSIVVSPLLDEIINAKRDSSFMAIVYAKSVLLHEYIHHIQAASANIFDSVDINNMDEKKYLSIRTEKEAWSVESYFS